LKANIPGDNLLIALEPEAAAIYCQYLPKEKLVGTDSVLNLSETGVRYMIVDLGGKNRRSDCFDSMSNYFNFVGN
jgi:hypothetical protein